MVFSRLTTMATSLLAKIVLLFAMCFASVAHAEYRLNLQDPVTEVARDIYGLHMLIFWICVVIFVLVFSVMFYSIFRHRKSKGRVASQFSHSTSVEVVWTIIPFLILVVMAIPATKVLIKMEDTTKSDLTIKITGYQWKWGYEYLDSDISFFATLSTPRKQIDQFDEENREVLGENYLLETDNMLVVPSGRKVRALITANDVIHAWWVPAFGTKKDAIPGYINELWFNVDEGKEGIYRGQCAELCGKDHAFMPIVVQVVSGDEFDAWVAAGGTFDTANIAEASVEASDNAIVDALVPAAEASEEQGVVADIEENVEAAIDIADSETPEAAQDVSTWTLESLMAKGKDVSANCVACHGAEGQGVAGVFPAIAGSAVATGPIEDHIKIIMFGKPGTAMASFARQLSDEEIAAVITYQRNAYGNDTGDVVMPADVAAYRN